MSSMNKAILIGNVGRDPEVRALQTGQKIANLRLATNEKWKGKDGSAQEKTEWHTVVVFGPLAEVVEKYVRKGQQLAVEGKIQTRKWQDQQGQDRYSTEIVLSGPGSNMVMLGGKSEGGRPASSSGHDETPPWEDPPTQPARSAGPSLPDDPFDDL